MKYRAVGTDRTTGQRRAMIVEAASEQEAAMEALVTLDIDKIWPVTDEQAQSAWSTVGVAPPSRKLKATAPAAEPGYSFMFIVGNFIMAVGFLTWLGGAIVVIKATNLDPSEYDPGPSFWVAVVLAAFIYGLFMLALGQGIVALRDIAMNSWHWRK